MQTCRVVFAGTGFEDIYDGYIIDGLALIKNGVIARNTSSVEKVNRQDLEWLNKCGYPYVHIERDGEHYFSPNMFGMFEHECDNNLTQLEIDGKWGYAHVETGEIVISPVWDWCGPFYHGYAMVWRIGRSDISGTKTSGCGGFDYSGTPFTLVGGKRYHTLFDKYPRSDGDQKWKWVMGAPCGYIDTSGKSVVTTDYTINYGGTPFTLVDGKRHHARIDKYTPGSNGAWEWIMDARCGYIDTSGELVVPLNYIDAEPIAQEGLFIVRKPEGLFGVVDVDGNIIIDFNWNYIRPLYSRPDFFVANAYDSDEGGGVYSLYSLNGRLIVDNLDATPYEGWAYPSGKYYKRIEELGDSASSRYLIVRRGGKFGVLADGYLLQEPTVTWKTLWPIIEEHWENNQVFSSKKYNKEIDKLGWGASDRYEIIYRDRKIGALANGYLLHEPTLTWDTLRSVIKKDWETNVPLGDYYNKIKNLVWDTRPRYQLLRRGEKHGVVANGRLLQEPTLTWQELWPIIQKDWETHEIRSKARRKHCRKHFRAKANRYLSL